MAVDQPVRSAAPASVAVDQPVRPVPPFPQVTVHDEEKYMTIADKKTDPMHEVRSILWTLLVAATLASVAANIAHALVTHGLTPAAVGPVLFAMLAPVALLGLFHLMAAWTRAAADRSAVFWFFLGAIVLLAGAAFRLSFAAIRDLAIGYGYGSADAALFPLILDGLIAVCTVGLVAATRPRRKAKAVRPTLPQRVRAWWRSAPADATQTSTQEVEAPVLRDEAPVTQPVEAPAKRDAERAQVATQTTSVRDVEFDEPATHAATQRDALRDADTEEIPVTCSDSRDAAAKQDIEPSTTRRLAAVPTPRPAATHAPASPATQTATDRDADDDAEYLRRATQLVEAGRTKAPVEVVVRVLRGKDRGASNRDVADETGLTESQVQRIVKAARELDAAEEPEPEPAFA
ncbi:DUF2637 domain-containing protein [Mycobacterium avium]|uniref:DUF2637 domain-containing protein n=1 Tax=Mycobacterium avium TaxID=1764 RepID=UPI001E628F7C|nr:DUF2637 domain-containing protein [Mycobacterium avium]WOF19455.1 DUF2637 domain-containing protein [Mycobacterium avium]